MRFGSLNGGEGSIHNEVDIVEIFKIVQTQNAFFVGADLFKGTFPDPPTHNSEGSKCPLAGSLTFLRRHLSALTS